MTRTEAKFISDTLAKVLLALNKLTVDRSEWATHLAPIYSEVERVYAAAAAEIHK